MRFVANSIWQGQVIKNKLKTCFFMDALFWRGIISDFLMKIQGWQLCTDRMKITTKNSPHGNLSLQDWWRDEFFFEFPFSFFISHFQSFTFCRMQHKSVCCLGQCSHCCYQLTRTKVSISRDGLVGYDDCLTRSRSWVQFSVLVSFDTSHWW